jgi:hypothetical protein
MCRVAIGLLGLAFATFTAGCDQEAATPVEAAEAKEPALARVQSDARIQDDVPTVVVSAKRDARKDRS